MIAPKSAAKGDAAKQKELVEQAKDAGTDQKKRRALLKNVEKTRTAKAAKQGKVLKIRAISDAELSEIGSDMATRLMAALEKAELTLELDQLKAWVAQDPELAVAYTFGALQALKVAAGVPNTLAI